MRLLFVKETLSWPRTVGHDVHAFEMMRALTRLGHDVGLVTAGAVTDAAIDGLSLAGRWTLTGGAETAAPLEPPTLGYLEARYARYWGIDVDRIARVDGIAREWKADAVVAVGLEVLPYLAISRGPVRVWYAADEWVWHYLTQITSEPGAIVSLLKAAAIKGLYERAFASRLDRVWVVSDAERRAMRVVTGVRAIDVLPNGVDADVFTPQGGEPMPHSAVFWGRLGFGPNLQALRWFVQDIWPRVRARVPDASFTVLGADPPDEIRRLDGRDGVRVLTNLPDLRPEIGRHEVTVLPFVSGGGIKNKLLEAAAMGQPIVATPRATTGLRTPPPIVCASSPSAFADAIVALWSDAARRRALGRDVRAWVASHHTWTQTATAAVEGIGRSYTQTEAAP